MTKLSLDDKTRWSYWMMIEHGPGIQSQLDKIYDSYFVNKDKFTKDKFYFACGYDVTHSKYQDWDCCDVRDITGSIPWDILMGFPQLDESLVEVKTKLAIGMMTYQQVRFLMREAARTLKVGGLFHVTFRDFTRLYDRYERGELEPQLFVRYIYGSGLYYGSRRRSCWEPDWVEAIGGEFNMSPVTTATSTGMNTTIVFKRVEGKLKKYSPEPNVKFNDDGTMHNEADDFHHSKVGK